MIIRRAVTEEEPASPTQLVTLNWTPPFCQSTGNITTCHYTAFLIIASPGISALMASSEKKLICSSCSFQRYLRPQQSKQSLLKYLDGHDRGVVPLFLHSDYVILKIQSRSSPVCTNSPSPNKSRWGSYRPGFAINSVCFNFHKRPNETEIDALSSFTHFTEKLI